MISGRNLLLLSLIGSFTLSTEAVSAVGVLRRNGASSQRSLPKEFKAVFQEDARA